MEADILRIILFLAGAALILGIYLADRYKQSGMGGRREMPEIPEEDEADTPNSDEEIEEEFEEEVEEPVFHREPLWQESDEEQPIDEPLVYGESALQGPAVREPAHQEPPIVRKALHQEPSWQEPSYEEESEEPLEEPLEEPEEDQDDGAQVEQELRRLGELINEERHEERHDKPRKAPQEGRSQQFSFRFFGGDSREEEEAPEQPELPVKILQINIVPREGRFSGDDILCAVSDVNLQYGEWGIYHSIDDEAGPDKPVFSLASMVEPGSFPTDDMEQYSTPGLTLFARLPGPKDGLTTFSELLFTAERLATLLEADLQDESHSDLSKQTIEHMREEIQEYHRQLQLARSR